MKVGEKDCEACGGRVTIDIGVLGGVSLFEAGPPERRETPHSCVRHLREEMETLKDQVFELERRERNR